MRGHRGRRDDSGQQKNSAEHRGCHRGATANRSGTRERRQRQQGGTCCYGRSQRLPTTLGPAGPIGIGRHHFELCEEGPSGRIARRGILGHPPGHQQTQTGRDLVQRNQAVEMLVPQLAQRGGGEGTRTDEALIEDGGGGVHVGLWGRPMILPLLGCHVARRAGERTADADRDGDAEIDEPGVAVGLDENVLRFVVAVDDAPLVRVLQSAQRTLQHDQRGLGLGGPLLQKPSQRNTVDRLHRQHRLALTLHVPVKARDVGMPQVAQGLGLLAEVPEEGLVLDQARRQMLDGDQFAGRVVTREDDLARSALAKGPQFGVGVCDAVAVGCVHCPRTLPTPPLPRCTGRHTACPRFRLESIHAAPSLVKSSLRPS